MREDRFRLGHPSGSASLASGEHSLFRLEDAIAEDVAQVPNVFGGLTMRPHCIVHRRHDEDGRLRREQHGGQQITGLSRRGAGDEIGRRGSDDDRLRFARELDVIERATRVEEAGVYRAASERLERHLTDEFGGACGEDDIHLRAGLA